MRQPWLAGTSAVFHALFYFWAAANLMVYMLADVHVTVDELFAVGATFTLLAWAFAYVFTVLQMLLAGLLHRRRTRPARAPGWSCCSSLHQPVQHRAVRRRCRSPPTLALRS